MEQQIFAHVTQFSSCAALLMATLLWMQRNGNHSRTYLAIVYLVCGIDFFVRTLHLYGGEPFIPEVLHPFHLWMALIELPLFLSYLIEIAEPGSLTRRRMIALYSPGLIWGICLLLPGLHFRVLHTSGDILCHLAETNVWLRIAFLLLMFLYSLPLYRISCKQKQNNTDKRLIWIYTAGLALSLLFFTASSVVGSLPAANLYLLYALAACVYIGYYEIFMRIHIPYDNLEEFYDERNFKGKEQDNSLKESSSNNELWKRLTTMVDEGQLWRNPNLKQSDLVSLLGTESQTLSYLFKDKGYTKGYCEYINRRRIENFIEIMRQYPQKNIQDVFFDVGYRSRMTAHRNFKEYAGTSPTEYLANLLEDI
jgi:AraC-like DNA-binding protein